MSTANSPPNKNLKKQFELLCLICGKPVTLETANTDAEGKAIHEECYGLTLKREHATARSFSATAKFAAPKHARGRSSLRKSQRDVKKMSESIGVDHALDEQGIDAKPKIRPAGPSESG